MRRLIDWTVTQFGPIRLAITQDRQGKWRLGLVKGPLRLFKPKYNRIEQAKAAYYMISKEVVDGGG
jgi:hypothetical protein